MKGLTHRQHEILAYLRTYLDDKGYPPTYREIMIVFGWSSVKAVQDHLKALEAKGYIKRVKGQCRTIQVIDELANFDVRHDLLHERIAELEKENQMLRAKLNARKRVR